MCTAWQGTSCPATSIYAVTLGLLLSTPPSSQLVAAPQRTHWGAALGAMSKTIRVLYRLLQRQARSLEKQGLDTLDIRMPVDKGEECLGRSGRVAVPAAAPSLQPCNLV